MFETILLAKQVISMEIEALEAMSNKIDNAFEKAVDIIYNRKGRVVVVGMGKSGHIG
jgi:arabinose-5-phosphate isomerase